MIGIYLLFDDDESEFNDLLLLQHSRRRKKTHQMYSNRDSEGTYQILVLKYLMQDEERFIRYFRISPSIFYHILEFIRDDITLPPCNRHKKPITAEQKLCIALRWANALLVIEINSFIV